METLIDSLLHFSRLGRIDLALDEVDVQEVVDEVVDWLGISLREQHVEVRIPRRAARHSIRPRAGRRRCSPT